VFGIKGDGTESSQKGVAVLGFHPLIFSTCRAKVLCVQECGLIISQWMITREEGSNKKYFPFLNLGKNAMFWIVF
jgi:hypothetical protein